MASPLDTCKCQSVKVLFAKQVMSIRLSKIASREACHLSTLYCPSNLSREFSTGLANELDRAEFIEVNLPRPQNLLVADGREVERNEVVVSNNLKGCVEGVIDSEARDELIRCPPCALRPGASRRE